MLASLPFLLEAVVKELYWIWVVTCAAILFAFSNSASAGLLIEGEYSSSAGYSFRPPKDWVKLDRSTIDALKERLPANLKSLDLNRVDVVFYLDSRPAVPDAADPAQDPANAAPAPSPAPEAPSADAQPTTTDDYFADSLSVMAIRNVRSIISKEIAVSLAEESLKRLQNSEGSYPEISKTEADIDESINGSPFVIRLRYKRPNDIVLNIRHYIFPFSSYTLIVSCTFQSIGGSNTSRLCGEAIQSFKFNEATK